MSEQVFTNLTNCGPVSVYVNDGVVTRIRPLVADDEAEFRPWVIEADGKKYSPSTAADQWWDVDAQDRKTKIATGDLTYLWYTFDIPEGSDSRNFQFQVMLPGI